jgi:hypothetical protein
MELEKKWKTFAGAVWRLTPCCGSKQYLMDFLDYIILVLDYYLWGVGCRV